MVVYIPQGKKKVLRVWDAGFGFKGGLDMNGFVIDTFEIDINLDYIFWITNILGYREFTINQNNRGKNTKNWNLRGLYKIFYLLCSSLHVTTSKL